MRGSWTTICVWLARGSARVLFCAALFVTHGCNILLLGYSAIDPPQPLPTIEGPENPHLLDDVHGTLLWRNQSGVLSEEPPELSVVRFPELTSTTIRFEDRPDAFDGPDDRGRFVYRAYPNHHQPQLRIHDLRTNEDRKLFEWSPVDEQIIRLSPSGGLLFTSLRMDAGSGNDRSSSRTVALIDIETLERRDLGSAAVRDASWFPDGHKLAIELWADVDANQGRALSSADAGPTPEDIWRGKGGDRAESLIEILDTESGDLHFCAFGRFPLASPDGHTILYFRNAPNHYVEARPHLFDLDSGSDRVLELPGLLTPARVKVSEDGGPRSYGTVYGWLSERIVLYDALATSGQRPGYVPAQDLMMGYYPKWTVKAADVDTLEFETVFPSANIPRASFGRSAADR